MLLFHFPLCPFSRKIRVLLHEKHIDFNENIMHINNNTKILENPKDKPPILHDEDCFFANSISICEYIEEKFTDSTFLGSSLKTRAKVREVSNWIDIFFFDHCVKIIMEEKIFKPTIDKQVPSSKNIHTAGDNIKSYIPHIEDMIQKNIRLASESFSLADITLAAHISTLDYTGDFPWYRAPVIKHWYSIIKSRPSFKKILSDRIPQLHPPTQYTDLDF